MESSAGYMSIILSQEMRMGGMLYIQDCFLDDSGDLECIHIHFETVFIDH